MSKNMFSADFAKTLWNWEIILYGHLLYKKTYYM